MAFSEHFSVFSGETGSGKTMVLGALQFACGARTDADAVRTHADKARVTLAFHGGSRLAERAGAAGFTLDPGEDGAIVRELTAAGRSSARINGQPATAAQLREITGGAIETVGQHDQGRMLMPGKHALMLDRFGGTEQMAAREAVAQAVRARDTARAALRAIEAQSAQDFLHADLAKRTITDIDAVDPQPDEDVHLRAKRDRQQHAQRIGEALAAAHAALIDDESSATAAAGKVEASLHGLERFGEIYAQLAARASAVQSELQDLGLSIAREMNAADADGDMQNETFAERVDAIERLKRRYGGTIANVLAERDDAQAILDRLGDHDAEAARATSVYLEREAAARAAAAALTLLRAASAARLEAAIDIELRALAMRSARTKAQLIAQADITENGAEKVEFLFSANAEREPVPLIDCASGGELSRILLAFTVILAGDGERGTLIFDEIDAGIGGETARAVGDRLQRLAERDQVICITHSAQIAARADAHFILRKTDGARTVIDVVALAEEERRVDEIARMLSGTTGRVAREHAAILLQEAR